MHGWYPMYESQSREMAAVGCWAMILLPLAAVVICLIAVLLHG
jgi:hypothetical protein